MHDNHSVYDTVSVALAQRRGVQLVTGDAALRVVLAGFDWVVEPGHAMGGPPVHGPPALDETAKESPMSAPIILVPGFWLGAWAWDEVAEKLRADGHDVTALTLPGLESADADRSSIHFADHVEAIVRAIDAADAPVVLAVHSATGYSGYAASDRVPERIAAMVYVDTAPGKPPLDPDFADVEKPLVWDDLAAEENLDGLSEEQQTEFRERAVPVPGALLREGYEFTNDARLDIPSTVIATGYSAADYQKYAKEHPEWSFLAGIPELHDITWIDLPTSHWPMWSRPAEVAAIIGEVATKAGAAHAAGASR